VPGRNLKRFLVLWLLADTIIMHGNVLTVTDDMHKRLEEKRKHRFLDSIPETIRMILSEHLSKSDRMENEGGM